MSFADLKTFTRALLADPVSSACYRDCAVHIARRPSDGTIDLRLERDGYWVSDRIDLYDVGAGAKLEGYVLDKLAKLYAQLESYAIHRHANHFSFDPLRLADQGVTKLTATEVRAREDLARQHIRASSARLSHAMDELVLKAMQAPKVPPVLSSTPKFGELFQHQIEGAKFLASKGEALLADEPGVGKTAQAIVACDLVKAKTILVVCPAVAKENWRREVERWQTQKRSVAVQRGTSDVAMADVWIVNYELLLTKSVLNAASSREWDVLILDEAHYLKSSGAMRTQIVYGKRVNGVAGDAGLTAYARRVWALTGTPAPNNALEIWPTLRALHSEALKKAGVLDEWHFRDKFCTTRETVYGTVVTGSKNLPELAGLLKGFMLRRKKSVLKLPPLMFAPEPLPIIDASVKTPELDAILAKYPDSDDALAALRAANIHLATERRLTGLLKAEAAQRLIRSELEGNHRKLVVFAIHNEVIDRLAADTVALGSVTIDGRTSPTARQAAIDKFQTDPNTRVFIGNITAAGTAITLTAANTVLFVEADWTPSDNYQAASRCHRIGQTDSVLARMLYLPGSIDETVQRVLARKASDLVELFG